MERNNDANETKPDTVDSSSNNLDNESKSGATSKVKKASKNSKKVSKEVQEKILAYMGQELQTDRKDISKQEVAEGCGFARAGSHRFFYSWQDLERNQKFVVKSGTNMFRLTDLGKDHIPKGLVLVSKKIDNSGKQKSFLKILKKQCKEATDKVDLIFDIMSDGQAHSVDEFTKATGYANLKSKGLGYPLSHMIKKMNIVEKLADNTYRFTDKCFPEGRPSAT